MIAELQQIIESHRHAAYALCRRFQACERPVLLSSDIRELLGQFAASDEAVPELVDTLYPAQEALVNGLWIYMALRPDIGHWRYARIHIESMAADMIEVSEYLQFKERLILGSHEHDGWMLEVDFAPFSREFPRMRETRSIGQGVSFLNRRLSSQLFGHLANDADHPLLNFLRLHQVDGTPLMLGESIRTLSDVRGALRQAEELLRGYDATTAWKDIADRLSALGFAPGWGCDVGRVLETMSLLSDLLEAPEPGALERFLGRIPMIFKLAVITPHGFFGQSDVLGRPDTGGQVVYILDQVRALEREMRNRLYEQGVDIAPDIVIVTRLIPNAEGTSCDQPLEAVGGTENARILRVPFRNADGSIVQNWISRFHIWPYLEQFASDVEAELLAEMGGRPDMVIGNYSDGNLVATLLSRSLQVTQCNVAHALEKSKYVMSDLYWRENDEQYHFACQFTADLIAMNAADFIITSTYQEIAGTREGLGQYESYQSYALPGLYRVPHGIDVFDPKFNIVSPGADDQVYFPFGEEGRRITSVRGEIDDLIRGERGDSRGLHAEPEKPLLFSMARLDRIKNITGLVEWYATHPRLQQEANLFVIAGHVDASRSSDQEEWEQIVRMHQLFDQHGLDGKVRWLGAQLDKHLAGELYRVIADRRGAFVQPALFEAFGLTVIEAMSSGLPVFATCYGGPMEIIEEGISGFHIDPNDGQKSADKMADFFERCRTEKNYWQQISSGGLARVEGRYTWQHYAERMMTLSRIYGFWKFVTNLERAETKRYLDMFYALGYRRLAEVVPRSS